MQQTPVLPNAKQGFFYSLNHALDAWFNEAYGNEQISN